MFVVLQLPFYLCSIKFQTCFSNNNITFNLSSLLLEISSSFESPCAACVLQELAVKMLALSREPRQHHADTGIYGVLSSCDADARTIAVHDLICLVSSALDSLSLASLPSLPSDVTTELEGHQNPTFSLMMFAVTPASGFSTVNSVSKETNSD